MLRSYIFLILLILIGIIHTALGANDGHCIWYGVCYKANDKNKNCPYSGPAKPLLDPKGQEILAQYCPHLLTDSGNGVNTCCDTDQLKALKTNLNMAANLLNRCFSCFSNFKKLFCDLTCSSNQSKFINITETIKFDNGTAYINEMDIYITDEYISGTYNSCRRVFNPNAGKLALEFMCGEWGASKCSPVKWFRYLGSKDTPKVPFQINYINTNTSIGSFVPLNPPITPCNKAVDKDNPACSCIDCEESCPVPPPAPPPKEPFTIFGCDGYKVTMIIVFISGTSIFIILLVIFNNRKQIVCGSTYSAEIN